MMCVYSFTFLIFCLFTRKPPSKRDKRQDGRKFDWCVDSVYTLVRLLLTVVEISMRLQASVDKCK